MRSRRSGSPSPVAAMPYVGPADDAAGVGDDAVSLVRDGGWHGTCASHRVARSAHRCGPAADRLFLPAARRAGGFPATGGIPWDIANFDPFDPTPRQTFAHWDALFLAWLDRDGLAPRRRARGRAGPARFRRISAGAACTGDPGRGRAGGQLAAAARATAAAAPREEPAPALTAAAPATGTQPVRLRIHRLGVDAAVQPVGVLPAGDLDVPADPAVLGWWSGSARPGAADSVLVDGVGSARGGPGAFFRLRELRPGDAVEFTGGNGRVLLDVVTARRQYADNVVVYAVPET